MSTNNDSPQHQLTRRGIDASARTAGAALVTHQGRPALRYQAHPSPAIRYKFLDGMKPKYLWGVDGKLEAVYYIPQGIDTLRSAIASAGGELFIANGEPALWSYLAAGINNVICWYGEASIPHTLSADLCSWGVKTVRYPADKDDAGRKSAKAVRSTLKASGITFYALEWGEIIPDKGDANDAWIAVDFDPSRFIAMLKSLKALLLPSDELPPRRNSARAEPGQSRQAAIAEVIRIAESRQGRQAKRRGTFANFCCVLHDERQPSAGINTETGSYTCFVCGSFPLVEVCERLSIDLPITNQPQPRLAPQLINRSQTAPKPPPDMPTIGIEAALNQFGDTGENVLYHIQSAAHRLGIASTSGGITLDQLEQAQQRIGFAIPRKTLNLYMEAARTIFTPVYKQDRGVNFVQRAIDEVKSELCTRAQRAFKVGMFRAEESRQFNPLSGEEYVLPAIPADLPADALEEIGLSPAEAVEAVELLNQQQFDRLTEYQREKARKAAGYRYRKFVASLNNTRHIALPDMPIRKAGDLVRAQARAWHAAGLFEHWSIKEQCAALGVSKKTLTTILADVGIEKDTTEITAEVTGDVQRAVKSAWEKDRAIPMTYTAIDGNGEIIASGSTYRKAAVETAIASGARVIMTYSRKVYHAVEIPTQPAAPAPQKAIAGKIGTPIKAQQERTSWQHYPRKWTHEQLRLRYRLKWGKDAPHEATARQLIESIIGRRLEASSRLDQMIALIA